MFLTQTQDFLTTQVLPNETLLAQADDESYQCLNTLVAQARQQGLWGQFFPQQWGGKITRLEDYLPVGYEEGRTEFAPTIFGGLATVDAYMLEKYGSGFLQENFLRPLSTGDMTSAYAMTEPDQPGSVPATLSCTATKTATGWRINGAKWFICNATKADYVTILAVTDPDALLDKRLSMFVVPTELAGCDMVRPLPIYGRQLGQGEYVFHDLELEDKYCLGEVGQGLAIMQSRVCLGRLLRAIHWLGLADRCLELMYDRIHSEKGQNTRLASKQLIRQQVFNSHASIESAKLLLKKAAQEYDQNTLDITLVNLAKVMASRALYETSDNAIQIYGAEGVSNMTPLAAISNVARTTRILDGADEALVNSIGADLIKNYTMSLA